MRFRKVKLINEHLGVAATFHCEQALPHGLQLIVVGIEQHYTLVTQRQEVNSVGEAKPSCGACDYDDVAAIFAVETALHVHGLVAEEPEGRYERLDKVLAQDCVRGIKRHRIDYYVPRKNQIVCDFIHLLGGLLPLLDRLR